MFFKPEHLCRDFSPGHPTHTAGTAWMSVLEVVTRLTYSGQPKSRAQPTASTRDS